MANGSEYHFESVFSILFPFKAISKARPRFGNGRVYTPSKTAEYEKALKLFAKATYKGVPIKGCLVVKILFQFEKPKKPKNIFPAIKPDLDNLQKALLDAMNGVLYEDDSQIIGSEAYKLYGKKDQILLEILRYSSPLS